MEKIKEALKNLEFFHLEATTVDIFFFNLF